MSLPSSLLRRLRGSIPTNNARVTLARDIHDGIAQDLVAVGYRLDSLLARPDIDGDVRREIRDLRLAITQTLADVRRELFALRSESNESLRTHMLRLYEEIANGYGGTCDVEDISLNDDDERVILEIARELLRNAQRHSHGKSIWLSLETSSTDVILTVKDDGRGGAHITQGHFGLLGIREKVAERQGLVKILGNHGSTITVSLPLLGV